MSTKQNKTMAEILAKGRNSVTKTKNAASIAASKKEDYKILPDYPKYEFNGVILRNSRKQMMSPKKSNKKFQLINKAGKNKDVSLAEIKEMFITIKPEKVKTPRVPKDKTPKVKKVTIQKQVIDMHLEGLLAPVIFEKLTEKEVKTNLNSVRWYISQYKNKK